DDLDHADRGTVELLEYLVRNLLGMSSAPVMFLLVREPPGEEDSLRGLISGDATGVQAQVLDLSPLSTSAVEELLLSVVTSDPRVGVLASRLQEVGEGNPHFIGEMIRGLMDEGVLVSGDESSAAHIAIEDAARTPLPVPESIRAALRDRLSLLSQRAKPVMGLLAVARQEVDLDLLEEASAMEQSSLEKCLEECMNQGLVQDRTLGGVPMYRLVQTRMKDVLLDEMEPEQVRAYHLEIAQALERLNRHRVTSISKSLAHHFDRAGAPAKAYPYLIRAAEHLFDRGFISEALEILDKALAQERQARPFMTLEEADRRLAQLHLLRCRALFLIGEWADSEAAARAAEALALELGNDALLSETYAELGAHARKVLNLEGATNFLRKALDYAERAGDRHLRVTPLYEYGSALWQRDDLDGARNFWLESMVCSESLGEEQALALGFTGLGLLAFCRGNTAEARKYLEQAIQICEKHCLLERLVIARINLVELYHCTGNLRKGLRLADQTVNQAREVLNEHGVGLGLRYRALLLVDLGRLAEAVENASEALRIHRKLESREDELATLVVLVRAHLKQEDPAQASARLEEALAMSDADTEGFEPVLHAWMARIHGRAGDLDRAREHLELAQQDSGRRWPHQLVRLELNLARAYHGIGDTDTALERAEQGIRIAEANGFRYYAMRARQLAIAVGGDEVVVARHRRVAEALARSLAANLSTNDSQTFLSQQGVETTLH
ncbi:MAG: tetratricopeptide repeat protein, partial [Myxococcota bacterium]|nr:tetratricopeptide repeat protein [Myxococcota bacterium]